MFQNALLLALRAIRRNLLRSFLTVLGIVIGVASVITMVNLGSGATAQVSAQIASLGSNLLMVRPGQVFGPGARTDARPFQLADVDALAREVSSAAAVSGASSRPTLAIAGNTNWATTVNGVDNAYFTVRSYAVELGRAFSGGEQLGGRAVCILGATVRKELFGSQDPVGTRIRLKNLACEVVGVLESKGQSAMGSDQDDLVLIPLRTFWRRIAGNQDVSVIQVSARDGVATERVQRDIELVLRERRGLKRGEEDDFRVMDMKQIANTLTGTTKVLTGLLGAVAAVSLLVGGIGIMNIMLVSVTERTREIGIRLAIGATGREVLMQFLVEAVVLSSFGGLFGIALAIAASWGAAGLLQVPFVVDYTMVLVAFLFSAAVGVVFGFFPARNAARLDPIEALRHE